jgi:ketosteroid isomerase-like protein
MQATRFSVEAAQAAVLGILISLSAPGAGAAEQGETARPGLQPSRCSTAIEDRNLKLFREYLAALTSGDIAAATSYFTPDAVVVSYGSVPFAGTYSATDGSWLEVQEQYWDFSSIGGDPQEPVLYADCDKVILNGPFQRTAQATGLTVDTRVIEYFTFNRAGKMIRDDFYLIDTAAVNEALGLP